MLIQGRGRVWGVWEWDRAHNMYSKINHDFLNNYLYLQLAIWQILLSRIICIRQILLSGIICIRISCKFYYLCIPIHLPVAIVVLEQIWPQTWELAIRGFLFLLFLFKKSDFFPPSLLLMVCPPEKFNLTCRYPATVKIKKKLYMKNLFVKIKVIWSFILCFKYLWFLLEMYVVYI